MTPNLVFAVALDSLKKKFYKEIEIKEVSLGLERTKPFTVGRSLIV